MLTAHQLQVLADAGYTQAQIQAYADAYADCGGECITDDATLLDDMKWFVDIS